MIPNTIASLFNLGGPDSLLLFGTPMFFWIPMLVVHVAFAIGIGADAARMRDRHLGTFLVSGGMWAFATLLGGLAVVAVYWLIHHSTLRPLPPAEK